MRQIPSVQTFLPELDYLIYSSHKTATQSLNQTLLSNGFKSLSMHNMKYSVLGEDADCREQFLRFKDAYGKKIKVVSVFRDPLDRHISSFFQAYGTKPLREKTVKSFQDTLIYKKDENSLVELFSKELLSRELTGYRESISLMAESLKFDVGELTYSPRKAINLNMFPEFDLFLFRFDVLVQQFEICMNKLAGRKLQAINTNRSNEKWYKSKYQAFKSKLELEESIICQTYLDKLELGRLFYGARKYDQMRENAVEKFGKVI